MAASGLAGYLSFPPLRVTCVHFSVSDQAASESELVARCPSSWLGVRPLCSVWRGSLSLGGVLSIEIVHADTRVDLPRRGVRGSSIACCAGLESTPAYAPFLRPTRLAVGIPVSAQPSRAECELLLLLLARKCGGRGVRSWLSRSKSSGAPWRSRYGST